MRVVQVDVTLEVPFHDVADIGDAETASRFVIEKLRRGAEDKAAEVKGRVLTDTVPEIIVHRRASVLTGQDMLLMASRWKVEVPEGARLE